VEPGGDLGLDLAPGAVEHINDPVRIYLREMGVVLLLTREGEVDIAKRIERGQRRVLKALSRSPIVIRQVPAIGEDLKRGARSIKEIVAFDEEEITEKVLLNGVKDTTCPHRRTAEALQRKLASWPDGIGSIGRCT
jgi:RNA polymerase primary sigma factor